MNKNQRDRWIDVELYREEDRQYLLHGQPLQPLHVNVNATATTVQRVLTVFVTDFVVRMYLLVVATCTKIHTHLCIYLLCTSCHA